MTPRRPRPLCAICADREATTITDWECESGATRTIVACWPCLSPVPDPPEEYEPEDLAERVRDGIAAWNLAPKLGATTPTRGAVIDIVRKLGAATNAQIRAELGFASPSEQNHVSVVLSRLVRTGVLVATDLVPGSPTSGRVYQVADTPPPKPQSTSRRSKKIRAAEAALASIDGEFTCAAAGISARMLTVLRRRGLVELVRAKRGPPYQPAIWRRTDRKEQPRAA